MFQTLQQINPQLTDKQIQNNLTQSLPINHQSTLQIPIKLIPVQLIEEPSLIDQLLQLFNHIELYILQNTQRLSDIYGFISTSNQCQFFTHTPQHLQMDIIKDADFKDIFIELDFLIFDDHQLKQLIRRPDILSRSLIDNIMGFISPIFICDKITKLTRILIFQFLHQHKKRFDSDSQQIQILRELLYCDQKYNIQKSQVSNQKYQDQRLQKKNLRFIFVNYVLFYNSNISNTLKQYFFPPSVQLSIDKFIQKGDQQKFIVSSNVDLIKQRQKIQTRDQQNLDDLLQIHTLVELEKKQISVSTYFDKKEGDGVVTVVSNLQQNIWKYGVM